MDISEILSNLTDDDIQQLKSVASTLMNSSTAEEKKEQNNPGSDELFNPSMISRLGKISNAVSGDDERTALLKALKPLLSSERQQKADEAIKIMRMVRLLPLLRESGLLNGIL